MYLTNGLVMLIVWESMSARSYVTGLLYRRDALDVQSYPCEGWSGADMSAFDSYANLQ